MAEVSCHWSKNVQADGRGHVHEVQLLPGEKVLSLSGLRQVQLTDLNTAQEVSSVRLEGRFCGMSANGDTAALVSPGGVVSLLDLRALNAPRKVDLSAVAATHPLASVALSPSLLAVGTERQAARNKAEEAEGELESRLLFLDLRGDVLGCYRESHSDAVDTLAFRGGCEWSLASGGADGLVNCFDLREGSEDDALRFSLNAQDHVARVGWLGSNSVYAVTEDGQAWVWDSNSGDEVARLPSDVAQNEAAATFLVDIFHNGGENFVLGCGGSGQNARLCRLKGTTTHEDFSTVEGMKGHCDLIRCLAFDEASRVLVTGGDDGKLIASALNFASQLDTKATPKL